MGSPSPNIEREQPKKKKKKDKRRSRSRSPRKSKRDKSEIRNGLETEDRHSEEPKKDKKKSPILSRSRSKSKSVEKSLTPHNRSPVRKKRRSRSRSSSSRRRRKSPAEQLDEFGRVISLRRKDRESPERERVVRERKPREVDIYDKRDDMLRRKRLANIESKLTEVETQRMIDECVNKRVKDEMAKKDAEIDVEVCRRVDNAKKILERNMRDELQSKKDAMESEMADQEEEHLKEIQSLQNIIETLKRDQDESKLRLDEERLEVVEAKRKVEEERQALEKELKKKEKMIQNQILGKSESNSRPRISFGMKKK